MPDQAQKKFTKEIITELAIVAVFLAAVMLIFSRFLLFVESRPGAIIDDPVLNQYSPVDLSAFCFFILYISILAGIVTLVRRPRKLILAMQAYGFMVLLRMAAMYLVPLDPPPAMIPLVDPFVEFFTTGGEPMTRDLFFSGHTATMTILFLSAINNKTKWAFIVLGIGVIFCIMAQHVHYTIDILAAVPFSYLAWRLALMLNARIHGWDFIYRQK
jgi:hypothetical protein